ncbi:hypothetical protein E4T56_gene2067 [Termitomyces sp. T112]|nr:hypothetical protein E4T56_gene2067 [Termitomyces sp. T112]
MERIIKWTAGSSYSGPPLSQTELYDLGCALEINPVLVATNAKKNFSLVPGQTDGFTGEEHTIPFASQRHQPATFPSTTELKVITKEAPWCTVVKNKSGVTVADVLVKIYADYTTPVEHWELMTLPKHVQDTIKLCSAWRTGQRDSELKRYDWLQHRVMFNGVRKDADFAKRRLGYDAPNIFVMDLCM